MLIFLIDKIIRTDSNHLFIKVRKYITKLINTHQKSATIFHIFLLFFNVSNCLFSFRYVLFITLAASQKSLVIVFVTGGFLYFYG